MVSAVPQHSEALNPQTLAAGDPEDGGAHTLIELQGPRLQTSPNNCKDVTIYNSQHFPL